MKDLQIQNGKEKTVVPSELNLFIRYSCEYKFVNINLRFLMVNKIYIILWFSYSSSTIFLQFLQAINKFRFSNNYTAFLLNLQA